MMKSKGKKGRGFFKIDETKKKKREKDIKRKRKIRSQRKKTTLERKLEKAKLKLEEHSKNMDIEIIEKKI